VRGGDGSSREGHMRVLRLAVVAGLVLACAVASAAAPEPEVAGPRPGTSSRARRGAPDAAKLEAEAREIEALADAVDIGGLVEVLSRGEFPSKVVAAEALGRIGDERALPALKEQNAKHGGWQIDGQPLTFGRDSSGAFAWAIWRILARDLPE